MYNIDCGVRIGHNRDKDLTMSKHGSDTFPHRKKEFLHKNCNIALFKYNVGPTIFYKIFSIFSMKVENIL